MCLCVCVSVCGLSSLVCVCVHLCLILLTKKTKLISFSSALSYAQSKYGPDILLLLAPVQSLSSSPLLLLSSIVLSFHPGLPHYNLHFCFKENTVSSFSVFHPPVLAWFTASSYPCWASALSHTPSLRPHLLLRQLPSVSPLFILPCVHSSDRVTRQAPSARSFWSSDANPGSLSLS